MDNIIYSLTRVSDAITDKVVYRANVQTNGTIGRDELAERLAARTKQDVSLWKYYIDALSDEIKETLQTAFLVHLQEAERAYHLIDSYPAPEVKEILANILFLGLPNTAQEVLHPKRKKNANKT